MRETRFRVRLSLCVLTSGHGGRCEPGDVDSAIVAMWDGHVYTHHMGTHTIGELHLQH